MNGPVRAALVAGGVALVLIVTAVGVARRPEPSQSTAPAVTAASAPASRPASAPEDQGTFYSSMTPYPAPPSPVTAPAGLVPVFIESLGRHGSRTPVSLETTASALRTWHRADDAGSLTSLGARLGPVLQQLDRTVRRIGAGNLTRLGEREERGIGEREGRRLAALFEQAASSGGRVALVTSGRPRTVASATSFADGLRTTAPRVRIDRPRTDRRLLYFHQTNAEYARFATRGPWRHAYDAAVRQVDLAGVSTDLLDRLYDPAFVATLSDPVAEAGTLTEIYRSAPALAADVAVDLTAFVPRSAAAQLAFVDDARLFYSRGPGSHGEDRSFRPAQVLLDDFYDAIDRRLRGGPTVAVYRFAHAEEVAPFAALLQLPGSEPLGPGQLYSWSDSAFRAETVVPLAANITWTVWRDPRNQVLVSVASDERPAVLGHGCRSEPDLSTYYRLAELERCLPRQR